MIDGIEKMLKYYCTNELKSFEESQDFLMIKNLAEELGYTASAKCGDDGTDKKNIYLSFSVKDSNGHTIWIEDDGYLGYALSIICICKDKKFKFTIWENDDDFIDSVEWVIKNLKLKLNK